jgi:SARP family transcriptional regulator, regulator of embCAB operon
MRYEVLGPMRLINDDRVLRVNAKKIGVLLIVLLSNANRVVSIDQIISEIWGDRVPQQALAGVYVYISQIRKIIAQANGSPDRVHTRPPGYLLQLDGDEVDAHSFLSLAAQGRAQSRNQQYELAAQTLHRALGYWRGPLGWGTDCGSNVEAFATLLTETHLEATELLIDAQLQLGYHRELVGRMQSLVAEHPLRETFHRQLMLALYRSDRRAEALGTYQAARRILLDELGLEPCRSLQRLQREILAADERVLDGYGA